MRIFVHRTGEAVIERGAAFGQERSSCGGRFLATPRLRSTVHRGRQAEEGGELRVPMQHTMNDASALSHDLAVTVSVPSISTSASSKNSFGCRFQTLSRARLIASNNCRTCVLLNRRQKSPAVVGSGIESAPMALRNASSFRRRSMYSRHGAPDTVLPTPSAQIASPGRLAAGSQSVACDGPISSRSCPCCSSLEIPP